jgi:hypothetical protein
MSIISLDCRYRGIFSIRNLHMCVIRVREREGRSLCGPWYFILSTSVIFTYLLAPSSSQSAGDLGEQIQGMPTANAGLPNQESSNLNG